MQNTRKSNPRVDGCQGDSGGPFTCVLHSEFDNLKARKARKTQMGVVSYGIGCGGDYPAVYERLPPHYEWIANLTNNVQIYDGDETNKKRQEDVILQKAKLKYKIQDEEQADDEEAEEEESGGGGRGACSREVHRFQNAPQSTVLGHCLAAGLTSASQLVVLQLTAPGVPDWPAATPHFVAHPVGSACIQVPSSAHVRVK